MPHNKPLYVCTLAPTLFFIVCFPEVGEEFINYHLYKTYYSHTADTKCYDNRLSTLEVLRKHLSD